MGKRPNHIPRLKADANVDVILVFEHGGPTHRIILTALQAYERAARNYVANSTDLEAILNATADKMITESIIERLRMETTC